MSTETSKFQIETGVDPSGVQEGMQAVEQAVVKAERTVTESSARSGKAMGGIGDSATKSAEKADKSLGNLTASIQRYNAQLESGGQKGAKYFESLADSRGLDKTNAAFQAAIGKARELEAQNQKLGVSAAQTAAAMRGVPAQFTDIITSLQGGQAPMTVLLQQGGQLKDMFGGAGNAAKALGTYVVGLVNPLTVTATAAAALGYAFYAGGKESSEFAKTLILTGNQAGVTSGQLMAMAEAVGAVSGTQGNAADVLNQLAATGRVAHASLQMAAQAAVDFERAGGHAATETVKAFAELGKSPLEASLKLNEAMGYLTRSTYAQIKALVDQGRTADAAALAQKAYADALGSRAPEMVKNLGSVERGWIGIKDAVAGAWDAIKSIGRQTGVEGQASATSAAISRLEAQIAARRQGGYSTQLLDSELAKLKERQSILQSDERLLRNAAGLQAEQAKLVQATADWDKEGEKYLSKQAQMQRDITKARNEGLAAQRSQAEIEARISAIREKYKESGTGQDVGEAALAKQKATLEEARQYAANLQRELEAVMAGDTSGFAKQTAAEKTAIELQAQLATGIKGVARANMEKQLAVALETVEVEKSNRIAEKQLQIQKDLSKQRDAELKALGAEAASIQGKADALNAELAVHGKSKVAIEEAALARMKERAAEVAMFEGSDDVVAALNAKIKAQEDYVKALKATDYKGVNEHTDELLRSAKEQQAFYQDELQLTGLTVLERAKVVAQRAVELKYAKELDALDKSGLSDAEKEVQRFKINEAKRIESAAASGKAIQAEYDRVSNQVEQSLTDALMRGFENGKGFAENLRDTIANLFKTLVLKPVIQAVVSPVAGSITSAMGLSGAGGAAGGMTLLSGLGNAMRGDYSQAYSQFATSSFGQQMGLAAPTGYTTGSGTTYGLSQSGAEVGKFVQQAGDFLGYASAVMTATSRDAKGGKDYGAGIGQGIGYALGGPIGAAIGNALGSALGLKDYGGTPHMGGSAQYSAASGVQTSTTANAFGAGEWGVDYAKAGSDLAKGFAVGTASMLDSVATTFGKKAGYTVATAFADDISPDGAVGALLIKNATGAVVAGWGGQSKTFADGTAGATEYAAAVAKDVRDYLLTQTPQWADDMLNALGDAPTIDQLQGVVQQLGATADALKAMGQASAAFASLSEDAASALIRQLGGAEATTSKLGSYYSNYYSEAERTALVTKQLSAQFADLGQSLPSSRDALRAMIDAAVAAGDTTLASRLIDLSGAFAGISTAAAQASASVSGLADGIRKNMATAYADAQASALSSLRSSISAQKAIAQNGVQAASDLAGEVRSVSSTLADAVRGLRQDAASPGISALQGQAYIAAALEAARATGVLPDASSLSQAIEAAKGGLGSEQFSSLAEQRYAQLKLAGSLEALGAVSDSQLTNAEYQLQVAQDQLSALDQTLAYWEQQVSAAQGNVTATTSVADAVAALQVSLSQTLDSGFTSISGLGAKTLNDQLASVASQYSPGTTANAISQLTTSITAGTIGLNDAVGFLAGTPTTSALFDQQVNVSKNFTAAGYYAEIRKNIDSLINQGMSGQALSQTLIDMGVSLTDASKAYGVTAAEIASNLLQAGATKLPKLAVGTNYVPQDMLAMIHEGEAVVPKAFNPWASMPVQPAQQSTAALEKLVQSLTAEVQRLQALVAQGNEHSRRMSDNIDQVTEGGAAMRTVVTA